MAYIHFWYKHFQEENEGMLSQLQSAKAKLWEQQQKNFAQRKAKMITSTDEKILGQTEDILTFLSNDGEGRRKEVFEANQPMTNNTTMGGGLTAGQMGAKGKNGFSNIQALMNQTADITQEFVDKLKNIIESAYGQLATGDTWENYKETVVQEYAQVYGGRVGSNAIRKRILNSFLAKDGLKKLGTTTGGPYASASALQTALRNLTLLAEALPNGSSLPSRVSYQSGRMSSSSKTKNQAEVLAVIASKANGMFSNIIGTGGEIAWAIAEEEGWKEFNDTIGKMLGKKFTISANTAGADVVGGQTSKADVVVRADAHNVTIEYGVSVKTYSFNEQARYQEVSIVSDTPFLAALQKSGDVISQDKYLNLLAAVQGAPTQEGDGPSENEIVQVWKEANKNVIINNFLDIIAGNAISNANSVLYLVLNGQIFTIDQILNTLASGGENFDFSFSLKGLKDRSAATKLNYSSWEENAEDGKGRSAKIEPGLYSILESAKIHVSLQLLTSLIK